MLPKVAFHIRIKISYIFRINSMDLDEILARRRYMNLKLRLSTEIEFKAVNRFVVSKFCFSQTL